MRKFAVFYIVMLLLVSGFVLIGPIQEAEAEEPVAPGNTLYVGSASTYATLSGALLDVSPGDTIYVAPGTYWSTSVYQKENLTIIGNASQGDVIFQGSVEFIPLGFMQSSNITMGGFIFNGSGMAMSIRQSHNITLSFNRFISQGGGWESVSVEDSTEVSLVLCTITSVSTGSFGITVDNSNGFLAENLAMTITGINGGGFEIIDSLGAGLDSITGTYLGDLIDAQNSRVSTIDTVVPDGDVSIDSSSTLNVNFNRRVIVKEEDNATRLQDVEIEFKIDGSSVYRSFHYGGTSAVSTMDGLFPDLPAFFEKRFYRRSTPNYQPNTMKFYYDGLDIPTEVDLGEVNAGTMDELHVIFPDMELPDPPQNVRAETYDEDTISIHFDASPSEDVVNYEIWYNHTTEWVHFLNTSNPGYHNLHHLEPSTLYKFRVKAVDDAGLSSIWVFTQNTTDDQTEGRINGTVIYSGGPLNGTVVVNATIELDNLDDINVTGGNVTDAMGKFDLGIFDFKDRYRIMVTPPNGVISGMDQTGYTISGLIFNHLEDTTVDLFVDHYEYVPPTHGRVYGRATYGEGPLMGKNATNATAILTTIDDIGHTHKLGNFSINETGIYEFKNIPFGFNYTVYVHPENSVKRGREIDGYYDAALEIYFSEEVERNITVGYYTYSPPTTGDILGRVVLINGPKDYDRVTFVEVELLIDGETVVDVNTTNEGGYFLFQDVTFGSGYSFRVSPKEEDLGVINVSSGYPLKISEPFDHLSGDTEIDIHIEYYEMANPSVIILDEDGDPVADVVVTITVNGTMYVALTDENGEAEFDDLYGESFPEGTTFKASKDGFDDHEWTEGEEVPEFVKDKDDATNISWIIIIAILMILIAIAGFFYLRNSGVQEVNSEE